PFTRRPTSSAEICTGVPSPRRMTSNAEVRSSGCSGIPVVSDRTAPRSALGALADTECFDQSLGKARVRGDEGNHEPQQTHAIDVFVDEDSVLSAIREVHDAHQLIVIDEGKADE